MTLCLDARQRAMLAQMGVRVFEPLVRELPVPLRQEPPTTPGSEPTAARPLPASKADGFLASADIGPLEWDALAQAVATGRACATCAAGARPVFGAGDARPEWLIVGDPPDEDEQEQGLPFMGEAGALLDNMLRAVGLDRQHGVFLTNILKCRLPGSRNPTPEELAQCEPVLRRQVQLLQPKVILVMGRFAVPALLRTQAPIGKLRGRAHQYLGVPVVATYHPAYLLRNPVDKARAWADLCLARELVSNAQDRNRAELP